MEIMNVRIEDVTAKLVGQDNDNFVVKVSLRDEYDSVDWSFRLEDQLDLQRLIKLMNYTESHQLEDLNGKIIRKVKIGSCLYGFGHPIEDKFISLLAKECKEINEAEFAKMYEDYDK